MATNLLLNHLLSKDAIELGRFVVNPKYPEQESKQPATVPDGLKQTLTNFAASVEGGTATSFKFILLKLRSLFKIASDHSSSLDTQTFINHQLKNSDTFFRLACKETEVRNFLESQARRRFGHVFLVCGFKTITDGHVENSRDQHSTVSGEATMSAQVASTIAGVPLPIPPELDVDLVTVEGERSNQRREAVKYDAPGEQIFAVQYRKVNFSWFSTGKVDGAYLESGNRWRLYGARGDDGSDGIEATLPDGVAPSELLEAGYSTFDVEGETFAFQVEEEVEEET